MRSRRLSMWGVLFIGMGLTVGTDAGRAQLSGSGVAPVSNGVGSSFELAFWQSVATSDDRSQYEAYLAQYPNGTFSALARAKIAAIDRARGIVPAPAAPVPALASPPVSAPAVEPVASPAAPPPLAPPVAPPVAPSVAAAMPPAPPSPVPAAPVALPDASSAAAPVVAPPANDPYAKLRAAMAARNAAAGGAPSSSPPPAADSAAGGKPVLSAVPFVALPDHFCSAEERNRFHETIYKPAVAIADQNNRAAIAYLDKLQADYDARSSRREIEAANSVAKEAAAYKPVAEDAYAKRSAFTGLFDRMMAVPIAPCS